MNEVRTVIYDLFYEFFYVSLRYHHQSNAAAAAAATARPTRGVSSALFRQLTLTVYGKPLFV